MFKKIICTLAAALLFASATASADLPSYYPKAGFQRVGMLDDVQLDRQTLVINDVPYAISDNIVVHSLTSFSVASSRLRAGVQVGYKMSTNGRMITELWLLPKDYKSPRRR